jgi:hypothetical protein
MSTDNPLQTVARHSSGRGGVAAFGRVQAPEQHVARRVSSGTDADWPRRLAWLLISGYDESEAISKCGVDGVTKDALGKQAQELLSSPLYPLAKLHTTRLMCREWLLSVYAALSTLPAAAIPFELRHKISRADFLATYYSRNQAVFFPGLASDWPAIALWGPEYLKTCCGGITVEVMMNRTAAEVAEQNTAQRLKREMNWSEYIDLVYRGGRSNDYYMVSRNNFFQRPGTRRLLNDVHCPEYVRIDDECRHIKLWFGPAGTVTPLHYDDMNNLIVQIAGRKTVRLYSSCLAELMQQSVPWYAGVDPSTSPTSPEGPQARCITRELNPGDALFIPVGWWHALEAAEVSITLAFTDFGVPNRYPMRWKPPHDFFGAPPQRAE